jgi:hypothetical protein
MRVELTLLWHLPSRRSSTTREGSVRIFGFLILGEKDAVVLMSSRLSVTHFGDFLKVTITSNCISEAYIVISCLSIFILMLQFKSETQTAMDFLTLLLYIQFCVSQKKTMTQSITLPRNNGTQPRKRTRCSVVSTIDNRHRQHLLFFLPSQYHQPTIHHPSTAVCHSLCTHERNNVRSANGSSLCRTVTEAASLFPSTNRPNWNPSSEREGRLQVRVTFDFDHHLAAVLVVPVALFVSSSFLFSSRARSLMERPRHH